jgi:hypothetical protein
MKMRRRRLVRHQLPLINFITSLLEARIIIRALTLSRLKVLTGQWVGTAHAPNTTHLFRRAVKRIPNVKRVGIGAR